ncbi:ATP-dependent DNA ligase [Nocardia sp. CY41]|uniref:ATP-dependent DNA ligase n=1 Tax=Nocardia sp. CY41 TaxID=2608686 RepID=UPI0013587D6B|nr:ATP-dependent DNA ligase [Nocardia sp. CY41]
MRAICRIAGRQAELYSRNRNNVSASFPELRSALPEVTHGTDMVLDGEIVAPDPDTGAPSFARLQRRMHLTRPAAELIRAVPVQLFVFDLLGLAGDSTMVLPYIDRRARLADLGLTSPRVRTPPYWTFVPVDTMLDTAAAHGLEGVVSKRVDSVYRPGTRSRLWLKTTIRQSMEVIVAGWVPSSRGGERGGIGSLILGAYDQAQRLVYVGHVGTGLTMAARRDLLERLTALATSASPFDRPAPSWRVAAARWVTPHLVGTVEYRFCRHHTPAPELARAAPRCRDSRCAASAYLTRPTINPRGKVAEILRGAVSTEGTESRALMRAFASTLGPRLALFVLRALFR